LISSIGPEELKNVSFSNIDFNEECDVFNIPSARSKNNDKLWQDNTTVEN
jgi:hypothetical protein